MYQRLHVFAALTAVSALALTGCASSGAEPAASGSADGKITVVASTNVYGEVAKEIGGDAVDVVSLIDSASQDPHEFEASAKEKLEVSRAQLVVMNGGGYDGFMDGLVHDTDAPVIVAAEFSDDFPGGGGHAHDDASADPEDDHAHDEATPGADDHGHTHIEGFNEHVWYDPELVSEVADDIAEHLGELKPADAADFTARAKTFHDGVEKIEGSLDQIKSGDHAHIFVTEPVPLLLTDEAGLHNVTPPAFTEAVEEGQDVPPATMLESVKALKDEDVRVVIANAQTGGAETTKIIDEAKKLGIPVLEWTELIPDGKTYLSWMQENVDELSKALAK